MTERNQTQEIYDYIRQHPDACTQDIVDDLGWNRYIVEMATKMMIERGLIQETGRADWDDPKFRATGVI